MRYIFRLQVLWLATIAVAVASCAKEQSSDSSDGSRTEGPMVVNSSTSAVDGEIIVKLKEGVAAEVEQTRATTTGVQTRSGNNELDRILNSVGTVRFERLFPDGGRFAERTRREGLHLWYYAKYDDAVSAHEMAQLLRDCSGIEIIEYSLEASSSDATALQPDTRAASDALRNETSPFNESARSQALQWHYNNTGTVFTKQTRQGADADVYAAWQLCTGNPEVIVAVIDQGVKYDHEDLADNMWINEAELNGTAGVDDDNNGYVDDIFGYNFITNSGTLTFSEEQSHGTHVAGTVAAVNNNGIGVCGIAGGSGQHDGVKIMSCEILSKSESGTSGAGLTGQIRAIKYAADNGAVICQNSWGYTAGTLSETDWTKGSYSALSRAVEYFNKYAGLDENGNQTGPMAGGIVLFAAGNDALNSLSYPASDKNVVSVAATNYLGAPSYFTNYGSWVSMSAPGGDLSLSSSYGGVYSTTIAADGNSSYGSMQGTSMACPHASGACALAVSYYYGAAKRKGLTGEMLRQALLSSTRPVDPYCSAAYVGNMGVGSLDTYKLLLAIDHIDPIAAQTLAVGETISVDLSAHFTATNVLVYSTADLNHCISVSLRSGVMSIKGLKKGSATVLISDGVGIRKSIQITVG